MKKDKKKSARVLNAQEIKKSLERFCRELFRRHGDSAQLAFIGIRTRGIHLARRLNFFSREDKALNSLALNF